MLRHAMVHFSRLIRIVRQDGAREEPGLGSVCLMNGRRINRQQEGTGRAGMYNVVHRVLCKTCAGLVM